MSRSARVLLIRSVLITLWTLPLSAAAELPTANPADVGLSASRLERLNESLQQHIDRGELAGAVALIARRGKIAHFEALGHMTGEGDDAVRMRRDTLFGIASMTKPITSAAVMMLHEEGHFQLDDPVSRYIPAMKDLRVAVVEEGHSGPDAPYTTVPATREITIRDLLRHTTGLTYGFMDRGPVGKLYREAMQPGMGDLGAVVKKLGELPLARQPGSSFVYGHSTDVLGYLVEVVSGQSLPDFLDERILRPLGMTDTGFYVPSEKAERLSALYTLGEDGLVHPGVRPFFRGYSKMPDAPSGGGGLVSTASDYARLLQMFLNGGKLGEARLLSRKSVELMTANSLGDLPIPRVAPGFGFGLGFAVRVDLGASSLLGSVGEYAWSGIFNTFFFVDPHEELFAILMTQTAPFGHLNLGDRLRVLVNQAIDD